MSNFLEKPKPKPRDKPSDRYYERVERWVEGQISYFSDRRKTFSTFVFQPTGEGQR